MITGVAIKLPTGEVRSLPKPARHCHLGAEYNVASRAEGWDVPWEGWPARDMFNEGCEQGFVTDTGQFLDRADAARHALACGQITELKFQPDTLFSEDIW